jgi:DNA polymerase I
VTSILSEFEQIVFVDFEFVAEAGELPDVVCVAWHEYPSGQTHRLWRSELGSLPPYRVDERVLYVCFVANAELGCHLALGWPLPTNVLDLNTEFRCVVNGRTVPAGKGLLGAMTYYGLDAISSKQKDAMRDRIMQGWPFTVEEQQKILLYVDGDVEAMVRLLPKMLPEIDLDIALQRGEVVAASARMEHLGVPMDMEILPQLTNKRAWNAVRDALVPVIDAAYGVYVRNQAGDWSFSMDNFTDYLKRENIAWPVTEKGKLSTSNRTFESMGKALPQLEPLRQLRYARNKLRKVKLAVGKDGRNRTTLWPCKAKTSRTQPEASKWIFSPAVFLRNLIKPDPGMAVAYVDWSSMEFMIAASLSGDPNMLEFYRSGDPYLTFAKRVGRAPETATKYTHSELRDRFKNGLLAAQYGIGPETLAVRLGVSTFEAHEMLVQHHELFTVYWRFVDDWLASTFKSGVAWTPMGWFCRIGVTEFNDRSVANWPTQSTGADILRLSVVWATRHKLGLCAPVHDALLLESPIERIEADVALLQEIMRRSSRVVLNSTAGGDLELRTDVKIVRHPDRYSDSRGVEVWKQVLALLAEYREREEAKELRHGAA